MAKGKQPKTGIAFELREPHREGERPIHLIIYFNGERLRVSTGLKVLASDWDGDNKRVRRRANESSSKNKALSSLEDEVKRICIELQAVRALNSGNLKKRVEAYLWPVEEVDRSLFGFIEEFIKKSSERINIVTGKKIDLKTIQKYSTVFSVLQEFSKGYSRKIDFETIDLDFYQDFIEYLSLKKGFSTNNVGKYVQTLKTFLNEASAKGVNKKEDYKSRRFKVVSEESDSVYLDRRELDILYNLDLSKNQRLERVRDLFLVGCWTGLRFSDLTNLRTSDIKNGFIKIEQYKTQDEVIIPCLPVVQAIIDKYKGALPKSISNQKMNDYIKEVCQIAGLVENVSKSITKSGMRITKVVEKWELVSVHTARRSFATNMYELRMPTLAIMAITGHKTESSFLKYIKMSKKEQAQLLKDAFEGKVRSFFEVSM